MHFQKRAAWPVVMLALLSVMCSVSGSLFAQRPLCTQLPAADRERARAAGFCRDAAPIIDVAPRLPDAPLPPTVPSTASSLAVPNVVGQSFDEARTRLTRFSVQRSYRAAAEAGGTVLAQTPMAPATLNAGAPVTLVLSDGSLVRVPRVTNININDARQRLQKDLDLKAEPVVVTSDLRVGTVFEQQPAEGTLVKRGSVVRLQVSAGQEGPELIDVPNVVGLPFDRAKARLARFAVERAERPRSAAGSAAEGQVVDQAPRAAARAVAGSVVVLTVASAPRAAVEVFEMPGIVGRSYADAARALAEFKVARTDVENAAPRGQVIAQTPAAGSTLMAGDAVALQVSAGAAAVAPAAPASAGSTTPNSDAVKGGTAASGVLAGVLGISAAVMLGLIVGALVMRQMLLRRRAMSAVDAAITSMTPTPMGLTSVDILLDEEPADRTVDILLEPEHPTAQQPGVEPSENEHENKNPGP